MMSKFKVRALASAILLASGCSVSYAASMSQQQIQAMVEQVVNQRTAKLQREVTTLEGQVTHLKSQLAQFQPKVSVPNHSKPAYVSTVRNTTHSQSQRVRGLDVRNPISRNNDSVIKQNNILTGLYLGGTPVFTSPYIGEHSAYDGSDLIVNQSNVGFDVRLLKQAQALENYLTEKGYPIPTRPVVELSGEVEGIGNWQQTKPGNTRSDLNLSDAELDVYAQINPWVLGFFNLSWEDSLPGAYRVAQSNVYVNKAFITVGNLNRSPWYASLGQLYVPFGQFSSFMISDPLTKLLGRTQARSLVLGYHPQHGNGIFAAGYVFKSDTRDNAKSAAGGLNLGYEFDDRGVSGKVAVGVINNIADSQGMQVNFAPSNAPFTGFGSTNATENIFKTVPAVDTYLTLNVNNYTFLAEYVDSTTNFDPRAMTFNGQGARVSAGHVEAAYNFHLHGKPGSFAVSYGFTKDALALFLPRDRYMAALNYSFWRNTVASLEFRHDVEYASSNTASGAGSSIFGPNHKYVNLVTGQFVVFF